MTCCFYTKLLYNMPQNEIIVTDIFCIVVFFLHQNYYNSLLWMVTVVIADMFVNFITSTQTFRTEWHHIYETDMKSSTITLIRAIINTCNRLNISSVVHGIAFSQWRLTGKSDGWDKIRGICGRMGHSATKKHAVHIYIHVHILLSA